MTDLLLQEREADARNEIGELNTEKDTQQALLDRLGRDQRTLLKPQMEATQVGACMPPQDRSQEPSRTQFSSYGNAAPIYYLLSHGPPPHLSSWITQRDSHRIPLHGGEAGLGALCCNSKRISA